MLLRVFSVIFPVFAISAIGYLYARKHRPDMAVANRLNMDIFLPSLIFGALANKSFDLASYSSLAMAGAIVVLGSGLIAWPVARWLRVDWKTFVPPMMFNNSGNMGIPLLVLAFGETALAAAVVLFLVEMTLHFTLGTFMLAQRLRLLDFLRIPMIIATIAGLLVSVSQFALPAPVMVVLRMLGDVSIPLLLFSLGVRLNEVSLRHWKIGIAAAIVCPVSGLLMGWAALRILQLPAEQLPYLWIFAALPPAVLNYIVSEQYRQEPEKVAAIVMIGNLGALVAMPLVLAAVLR
ncbi:MAG: AEC family transporter [Gammaproteobacteria bacterium]|nr:AEC family transporter [Gammaproteobacteria bacterium]